MASFRDMGISIVKKRYSNVITPQLEIQYSDNKGKLNSENCEITNKDLIPQNVPLNQNKKNYKNAPRESKHLHDQRMKTLLKSESLLDQENNHCKKIEQWFRNSPMSQTDQLKAVCQILRFENLPDRMKAKFTNRILQYANSKGKATYFYREKVHIQESVSPRSTKDFKGSLEILQENLEQLHTHEVEKHLEQQFPGYNVNSITNFLVAIIANENILINFKTIEGIESLKTQIQSLEGRGIDVNGRPNALHLNSNLSQFVLVQSPSKMLNVFEATSVHLIGSEKLSTTLQILTYQEIIENSTHFQRYCAAGGFSEQETICKTLSPNSCPSPPILHFLSNCLNKNIVVHIGSIGKSNKSVMFGDFGYVSQIHVLAVDWRFFPLSPITTDAAVSYTPFIDQLGIQTQGKIPKSSLCSNGIDFTSTVSVVMKLCDFCVDFKENACTHVFNEQLVATQNFTNMLKTKEFGNFSASDVSEALRTSNQDIPDNLQTQVVKLRSTGDGSCLFHAISLSLTKTEKFSLVIRKAVMIDFKHNQATYNNGFDAMNYTSKEKLRVQQRIFSSNPNDWPLPETILIASKLINRKIIVFSKINSHKDRILYDLSPQQSADFNPILLWTKDNKHFSPLIPYDWNTLELPGTSMNQFKRMNVESNINDIPTGNANCSAHDQACKGRSDNCADIAAESFENVYQPMVPPNHVEDRDILKANKTENKVIVQKFDSGNVENENKDITTLDDSSASIINNEQNFLNKDCDSSFNDFEILTRNDLNKPKHFKDSDLKDFFTIVKEEAAILLPTQTVENVKNFATNISASINGFWKNKLISRDPKHVKRGVEKARKYIKYCESPYIRNEVAKLLTASGFHPQSVKTYTKVAESIGKKCDKQRRHNLKKNSIKPEKITRHGRAIKEKLVYKKYNPEVNSDCITLLESDVAKRPAETRSPDKDSSSKTYVDARNILQASDVLITAEDKESQKHNASVSKNCASDNIPLCNDQMPFPEVPSSSNTIKLEKMSSPNGSVVIEEHVETITEHADVQLDEDVDFFCTTLTFDELREIGKALGATEQDFEFQPRTQFEFEISDTDIKCAFNFQEQKFIEKEWPNIISKYVTREQGCCSFKATRGVFYYSDLKSGGFSKMNGTCDGECKLSFCLKIREKPSRGMPCKVDVSSSGQFRMLQSKPTGRQLRGNKRKEMGTYLERQKPYKVFLKNINKMTLYRILHNNHDQKSLAVLKVIRSDNLRSIVKCKTPAEDIEQFRLELIKNDKESRLIKGYIQHSVTSENKLLLHLYTENALELLNSCSRNSKICLHFDATGSVVRTIKEKPVLLYTAVAKTSKNVTFTLAEMLSQRGREVEISDFFKRIKCDMTLLHTSRNPIAHVIVTDFSFAMLNGVSSGANNMALRDYIRVTWNVLNGHEKMFPTRSVLFICTSHLVHAVSGLMSKHLSKLPKIKDLHHLAVSSVVKMQECTTMDQLYRTSVNICRIFGCQTLQESTLNDIKDKLKATDTNVIAIDVEIPEFCNATDFEYCKELKKHSPFYTLFKDIRQKHAISEFSVEESHNQYYCNTVLDVIQNNYAPFVSLFSAMMLQETNQPTGRRLVNAAVESEFKNLKTLYHDDARTSYSAFVRRHYEYSTGNLKSVMINAQAAIIKKPVKSKRRRRLNESDNDEETWKHKSTRKRSKYVSSNAKMLSQVSCNTSTMKSQNDQVEADIANLERNSQIPEQTESQNDHVKNIAKTNDNLNEFAKRKTNDNNTTKSKSHVSKEQINDAIEEVITLSNNNYTKDNPSDRTNKGVNMLGHGRTELASAERVIGSPNEGSNHQNEKPITVDLKGTNDETRTQSQAKEGNDRPLTDCNLKANIADEVVQLAVDPKKYSGLIVGTLSGSEHDTLSMTFQNVCEIAGKDEWLEDKHVDFCLSLLHEKFPDSKYTISKSHTVFEGVGDGTGKISWLTCQAQDKESLSNASRGDKQSSVYEKSYFNEKFILHPLQRKNHWTLLCLNKEEQLCTVLDSNRATYDEVSDADAWDIKVNALPIFLENPSEYLDWIVTVTDKFPKQRDSSSCGLFVIQAVNEILQLDKSVQLEPNLLPEKLSFLRDPNTNHVVRLCENVEITSTRCSIIREILTTTPHGIGILQSYGQSDQNLLRFLTQSNKIMASKESNVANSV